MIVNMNCPQRNIYCGRHVFFIHDEGDMSTQKLIMAFNCTFVTHF